MPTYVYETIPQKAGVQPRRFEVRQSIHASPLTRDPETGEPVQRVITAGVGVITHQHAAPPRGGGCCGGEGGCGCHCAAN